MRVQSISVWGGGGEDSSENVSMNEGKGIHHEDTPGSECEYEGKNGNSSLYYEYFYRYTVCVSDNFSTYKSRRRNKYTGHNVSFNVMMYL